MSQEKPKTLKQLQDQLEKLNSRYEKMIDNAENENPKHLKKISDEIKVVKEEIKKIKK